MEYFEDQNGGYGYGIGNQELTSSLAVEVVLVFLSLSCSGVSIVDFKSSKCWLENRLCDYLRGSILKDSFRL